MSFFNAFFKPYAQYTINTTLTEDELKARIEKNLPEEKVSTTFKAMQREDEVTLFRTAKPLVLQPYLYGNNTLRGIIHLQCNKSENPAENTLTITIAPRNASLFPWVIFSFSALLGIFMLLLKVWQAVIPFLFIGILFLMLRLSRTSAEREIPLIRYELENILNCFKNR